MEPSIRKNWVANSCLGMFVLLGIVFVGNKVLETHRSLVLKQTHNDLKWIAMALHHYHDAHGCFPPVVVRDGNGNALHSWRSVIQSRLGDLVPTEDNFRAYRFSEPWDSEANQRSVAEHRFGDHPYQFLAIVGPGAAWSVNGTRKLEDFTDGTSNTALVIAVRSTSVRWHQPVDAVVTETGGLSVNGRPLDLSDDVFVLMADGTAQYAGNGLSNSTMSALITIDAGDAGGLW